MEVDNHNQTLSCLNEVWVKLHRDFINNNVTASENPEFTKITFSDKNLLDGWEIKFSVEMPISEFDICL